jgi:hypothetical protein
MATFTCMALMQMNPEARRRTVPEATTGIMSF